MTIVIMRQMTKNRWQIESLSGILLLDDIILPNKEDAKLFIRAYVSSFNWGYRLVLKGE